MLFTRHTSVSYFFEVIGWHHQIPIFPLRQLVMKLSFFISRGLDAHCLPGKHDIIPSLKKNERLLPATQSHEEHVKCVNNYRMEGFITDKT